MLKLRRTNKQRKTEGQTQNRKKSGSSFTIDVNTFEPRSITIERHVEGQRI